MSRAEVISTLAFIVSLGAFGLSLFTVLRDRAKLVVRSKAWPANEYGDAGLRVTIVNAGRRPIVIRMLLGIPASGKWSGSYFGDQVNGITLAENSHHEVIWRRNDIFCGEHWEEIAEDMAVEDSLGRRHPVQDAKENLKILLAG